MTAKTPNTELIDYQFKVMNERLESHQEYTKGEFKSLHSKLDKFIDTCNETFATKQDHEANSKRITELESDKKAIIKWIVISFV